MQAFNCFKNSSRRFLLLGLVASLAFVFYTSSAKAVTNSSVTVDTVTADDVNAGAIDVGAGNVSAGNVNVSENVTADTVTANTINGAIGNTTQNAGTFTDVTSNSITLGGETRTSWPISNSRNRIINGGFDIWQRGTSFNVGNNVGGYTADRWQLWDNGGVGSAGVISRQTFTPGQTEVAGNPKYFFRLHLLQ